MMAYLPYTLSSVGTPLKVELPEAFCKASGQAVSVEVCDVPFRPSVNPSERERAMAKGRDAAG